MKIAFITNIIPPYRLSFYQKLCQNKDHEWLILHGYPQEENGRPAYEGSLPFNHQVIGMHEWKIGPYAIRWQKDLLKNINLYQPDLIIVLGIPGTISNWLVMFWAKLHRKKILIWYGGWEAQHKRTVALRIKNIFMRLYYGFADHIFSYSTKGYQYLQRLGVRENRITICYNGIETDGLEDKALVYSEKADKLRSERGIVNQTLFLYVGGMLKEKKVDVLINAFSSIARKYPAELWLVGDGPDINEFKELSNQLNGNHIHFMGRIIEDIEPYFKAADYFVLPGIGGLAINQALYWELPCIVGEADGTEDDLVFDHKTGFRFLPEDIESLEAALEKCIKLTPEKRREFGENGKELILKRSNVNEMVHHFIETINANARVMKA